MTRALEARIRRLEAFGEPVTFAARRSKAERDRSVRDALRERDQVRAFLASLTGPRYLQQRAAVAAAMRADT